MIKLLSLLCFLFQHILYRQKEQFSDGVGYSWIDGLKDHANSQVSFFVPFLFALFPILLPSFCGNAEHILYIWSRFLILCQRMQVLFTLITHPQPRKGTTIELFSSDISPRWVFHVSFLYYSCTVYDTFSQIIFSFQYYLSH